MVGRAALVLLTILLAGCSQTIDVSQPGVGALPVAGDLAVYAMQGEDGQIMVRYDLVAQASGGLRVEQTLSLGDLSKTTMQWIDPDGLLLARSDGQQSAWFEDPCHATWFGLRVAECSGWTESLADDGQTRDWRPLRIQHEALGQEDGSALWQDASVDVVRTSVRVTESPQGAPSRVYRVTQTLSDGSCFPLEIIEEEVGRRWVQTLLFSRCAGVEVGTMPPAVAAAKDALEMPGSDRQPEAWCAGHMGANQTNLDVERPFSCGIYDAFTSFWLAPGQSLHIIAEWAGPAPAGMRLEADGLVKHGTVSPLRLELEGFSVSQEKVRIQLFDNAVAADPETPLEGRAVTITLRGVIGT